MSVPAHHDTEISAPVDQPTITIVRDFDAEPATLFRAWTDAELFAQWVGPRSIETRIEHWDARTGGGWRYTAWRGDERIAGFYGSFHELRPNQRLVQTFAFDGAPDGLSLDILTLEPLLGGLTRATMVSVVHSLDLRNSILSSGMDSGVREGFDKLDTLLTTMTRP